MRSQVLSIVLLVTLAFATREQTSAALLITWKIRDLGPGSPSAINDSGQVVGDLDGNAVLWGPSGEATPIGRGSAYGINGFGQVVGESDLLGFRWDPRDGMEVLRVSPRSWTFGVNDSGLVVGTAEVGTNTYAFIWRKDGSGAYLEGSAHVNRSGHAINSSGQVVGTEQNSPYPHEKYSGFIWSEADGLKILRHLHPASADSSVSDINSFGQVVGSSVDSSGNWRAVLWTTPDAIQDLGTLGGTTSRAFGINDRGQVVGGSEKSSGAWHAFLWTADQGMVDLGTLGGTSSGASAINNYGQIVGTSANSANEWRAVVWQLAVNTQTTLAATSPNPLLGQPVIFRATVTSDYSDAGPPLGTVQFKVDGADYGPPVALANGIATLPPVAILSPGAHTISSVFTSSHEYWKASTGMLTVNVQPLVQDPQFYLPFIGR